jgi:hypothetical protein
MQAVPALKQSYPPVVAHKKLVAIISTGIQRAGDACGMNMNSLAERTQAAGLNTHRMQITASVLSIGEGLHGQHVASTCTAQRGLRVDV